MRKCRTCNTYKNEEDFPIQRKGGFRGDSATITLRLDCKECVAEAAREYRKIHKYQKTPPKAKTTYLMSAIGCRLSDARQRKAICTVSKEYLYALYEQQQGLCALSGEPLTTHKGSNSVLSLDQINAGLGYVEGNVQWVTWSVNRAKGDLSMPEFLHMCRQVLGRCNDYPVREYSQVAGSAQHPEG